MLVPRGTRKTDTPRIARPLLFDPNLVMENDQGDGVALGGREVKKCVTRDMEAKGTADETRPSNTLWRNLGENCYNMRDKNVWNMATTRQKLYHNLKANKVSKPGNNNETSQERPEATGNQEFASRT